LMLAGATAFTLSAMQLRSANMNIVRMSGAPYFITDATVRNQYMVRVINKTNEARTFQIKSASAYKNYTMQGNEDGIAVPPLGEEVRTVIITVDRSVYEGGFPFELSLISPEGETIMAREAEFLGPNAQLLEKYGPGNNNSE